MANSNLIHKCISGKVKKQQQQIGIFHAHSHALNFLMCGYIFMQMSGFHYVIKSIWAACFLWRQTDAHQLHNTSISNRTQLYGSDKAKHKQSYTQYRVTLNWNMQHSVRFFLLLLSDLLHLCACCQTTTQGCSWQGDITVTSLLSTMTKFIVKNAV